MSPSCPHGCYWGSARQFLTLNPRIGHPHRAWKAVRPLHSGLGGGAHTFPYSPARRSRRPQRLVLRHEGQHMAVPTRPSSQTHVGDTSLLSGGGGRRTSFPGLCPHRGTLTGGQDQPPPRPQQDEAGFLAALGKATAFAVGFPVTLKLTAQAIPLHQASPCPSSRRSFQRIPTERLLCAATLGGKATKVTLADAT